MDKGKKQPPDEMPTLDELNPHSNRLDQPTQAPEDHATVAGIEHPTLDRHHEETALDNPSTMPTPPSRLTDESPTRFDNGDDPSSMLGSGPVESAFDFGDAYSVGLTGIETANQELDPTLDSQSAVTNGFRAESAIGNRLGDYQILSLLGRGGMGVVYRARHEKLKRDVALKMILAGTFAGPEALNRFAAEARAVAKIQHPNIVQLFDTGEFNGMPFFTLELVDGKNLSEAIQQEPLSPTDAAILVSKLARAMQAAHDQGILHRDLKPANILLARDGTPKITDFGLAKELFDSDSGKTRTGQIMGTPSYMSPEQASGKFSSLSPATDQYSLAAILYASISGRPPFLSANPVDTMVQVVNNEPVSMRQMIPEVPLDLDTICLKILQKDPLQRYSNCAEMADDLDRFVNGEPIMARPAGVLERSVRWCNRNPRIAVPTACALACLLGLIALGTWSYFEIKTQRDSANQSSLIAEKNESAALVAEELAKQNQILAEQNAAIAKEQADVAHAQATKLMQNIQFVITEVDNSLAARPGNTELRREIANRQIEVFDQLEDTVRLDATGPAIPTLMGIRLKLALIFQNLGEYDSAVVQMRRTYELAHSRFAVKGRSDAARLNLARICLTFASLRDQLERSVDDGVKLLNESLALTNEILTDPRPEEGSPSLVNIREVHAEAAQRLGVSALKTGDLPVALVNFQIALKDREINIEVLKTGDEYQASNIEVQAKRLAQPEFSLDKSNLAIAYVLLRMEETAESIVAYEEALAGRRRAMETFAGSLYADQMRQEYGSFCGNYGEALLWLDRPLDARKLLEQSLEISENIYDREKVNVENSRQFALSLYRNGALCELEQTSSGAELFARSEEIRAAIALKSGGARDEADWMVALARVGEAAKATELIQKFSELKEPDAETQLKCARALVQLIQHAGDEKDQAKAKAYAAIERTIAEGYSDPFKLKVEVDFFPIAKETRFRELLANLDSATK